ncbi:DUF4440 domain-containing protein [Nonomuraea sp. NPDC050643]|uniref:YybH family protein n=1 Tax=Nonomuraea sp. NPDC050643 TaxID=3155660 RepID=UPI0033D90666
MKSHDIPPARAVLADDPDSLAARFVAAMNAGMNAAVNTSANAAVNTGTNAGDTAADTGEPHTFDHVYEDGAVLVPVPGHPVTGAARVAANRHLQSFGLPIEARPRHVYVSGDIALLIVDWSMRGTARDGTEIDLSGTATDVARRGADGRWRYVIDNPHGTATPPQMPRNPLARRADPGSGPRG